MSAPGTCAERAASGVATACENLSEPNTLPGGLEAVAEDVSRTPIRGMITSETTARNSEGEAMTGIEENQGFVREDEAAYHDVTGHYCLKLFTNIEAVVEDYVHGPLKTTDRSRLTS